MFPLKGIGFTTGHMLYLFLAARKLSKGIPFTQQVATFWIGSVAQSGPEDLGDPAFHCSEPGLYPAYVGLCFCVCEWARFSGLV